MRKVNRHVLLAGVAMTAAELSKGRFMRAPDGHGDYESFATPEGGAAQGNGAGGADSGSGVTNPDGNNRTGEEGTGNQNNTGTPAIDAGFWETKPEVDTTSQESDQRASTALGQELSGMITGFNGPAVFNKEISEAIASGDFDSVNKGLQAHSQQVLKQATIVSAKIVETMLARQEADFEARIQKALGKKDESMVLEEHFPSAKNAAFRPVVQRVWDQSLINAKGDRAKAIELTRGMLKAFGSAENLGTPPQDPSGANDARSKSLVDELLGR